MMFQISITGIRFDFLKTTMMGLQKDERITVTGLAILT